MVKKRAIVFIDGNNWHARSFAPRGVRSLRLLVLGRFACRGISNWRVYG